MIWFWIVFWWVALSFPIGVVAGRLLARAADTQSRPVG